MIKRKMLFRIVYKNIEININIVDKKNYKNLVFCISQIYYIIYSNNMRYHSLDCPYVLKCI